MKRTGVDREAATVWPTSTLPVAQWMQAHPANVTLCDHFFHAAFGGSFLNHFWLIAAQGPTYPNYPTNAGLAAARGVAVLVISTDLDELLEVSDRIGVMFQGRLAGIVANDDAALDRIRRLMTGAAAA